MSTAQKTIDEKQKELIALAGGLNGMLILIATQQLNFTGKETLSMPADYSSITLEDQSPTD